MALYKAVVTGGAGGIGYAICSDLLEAGGKVCILDMSASAGAEAQKTFDEKYGSGKAVFLQCDVSKKDQLRAAFLQAKSQMGGLNVVVNNAGVACTHYNDEEKDRLEEMISVNLGGVIYGMMLGLELMGKTNGGNGGVIINIASIAAFAPISVIPVYAATKAGVVHFSRCIWQTYQDDNGVRVNCVCPDGVYTDMIKAWCASVQEGTFYVSEELKKQYPINDEEARRKYMIPSDIGGQVMKLIQDESKSGKVLRVGKNVEDPDKRLNIEYVDFQVLMKPT